MEQPQNPLHLMRDRLRKTIHFKSQSAVELTQIPFVTQSQSGINPEKSQQENKERSVLKEVIFQIIIFNKFIELKKVALNTFA